MKTLKEGIQRVQDRLQELGYANQILELEESTRTAQEAAEAMDCEVAQIAKSIIFRLKDANKPLLVVASGANRVNEKQIAKQIGDTLEKADANFVRERTGFVIGGVAPLGHSEPILTLLDEDLFQYDKLWAAAGHPKALFSLTPDELKKMTNGTIVSIK